MCVGDYAISINQIDGIKIVIQKASRAKHPKSADRNNGVGGNGARRTATWIFVIKFPARQHCRIGAEIVQLNVFGATNRRCQKLVDDHTEVGSGRRWRRSLIRRVGCLRCPIKPVLRAVGQKAGRKSSNHARVRVHVGLCAEQIEQMQFISIVVEKEAVVTQRPKSTDWNNRSSENSFGITDFIINCPAAHIRRIGAEIVQLNVFGATNRRCQKLVDFDRENGGRRQWLVGRIRRGRSVGDPAACAIGQTAGGTI